MFGRDYNQEVEDAKDEHKTIRCLEKVFAELNKKGLNFSYHNTILVDSDENKTINHMPNTILTPKFDESHFKSKAEDVLDHEYIMGVLTQYLIRLLENADDVRTYLRECPIKLKKKKTIKKREAAPKSVIPENAKLDEVDEKLKGLDI